MNLRDRLIRLGSANPNLRPHLRLLLRKLAIKALGSVATQEAKMVGTLINERMEVDWVTDTRDPRWKDAIGTERYDEAFAEFVSLNERILTHVRKAAREFYVFLEGGGKELGSYGLTVKVGKPEYFSTDPEEWVASEFAVDVMVKDHVGSSSSKMRYRVDVRNPLSVTDTVNDINFMASGGRDSTLSAADMFIQSMSPFRHLKDKDFGRWRQRRQGLLNDR